MQRGIKAALIAALAIAVCIFCAYTFIVPEYTVSFFSGDELLASQDVKYGSRPEVFAPEMEGCVFTGWTDGSGGAADPFGGRVTADAEYHAGWRVELTEHEPYLFTDENGLIRPDDVMTGSELRAALEALAPDGAEQFLPEISGGELTGEAFAAVLDELFPGEGSALTPRSCRRTPGPRMCARRASRTLRAAAAGRTPAWLPHLTRALRT